MSLRAKDKLQPRVALSLSSCHATTLPTQRFLKGLKPLTAQKTFKFIAMDLYDEVIEVKNGREIDSPTETSSRQSLNGRGAISRELSNDLTDDNTMGEAMGGFARGKSFREIHSRSISPDSSESISRDQESKDGKRSSTTPPEPFNAKAYESVDAPSDIKELMQYISRYTPQRIPIEYRLRVFIPDYIPAVGDIDAFLKISPPEPITKGTESALDKFTKSLGLQVLDEPCGQQSDEVLLQMKLRSIFPKALETPSAIAKSPKDVERWISEIQALHVGQPTQNAMQFRQMPDIDQLMSEWPESVEKMLDSIGFPTASLDCPLSTYTAIVAGLFDIPINNRASQMDYIAALYTLFNLYIAVKGDVN